MAKNVYAFRLSDDDRKNLEEIATVYGAKSPSEFAREMVTTMCSGDPERVSTFTGRLFSRMNQQMLLELRLELRSEARKQAKKALPKARKGKGASHG